MVSYNAIKSANASLKAKTSGTVAVVVGGTNGIGRAFLTQLAASTESSKIYFIGRSPQALSTIQSELTATNASNSYIPIQANDLTLLSSARSATQQITSQEKSKIDILFMSPGFLTFAARNESAEGIDKITAIRYYSRMTILLDLLPLLEKAPAPRVVNVLAAGLEGAIFPDDMSLKSPANYGVIAAGNVAATYLTLGLEQVQSRHRDIAFVHIYPGTVRTNLLNTEHFGAVFKIFVNWFVVPVFGPLFMITPEECGARCLYAATDGSFALEKDADDTKKVKGSNGQVGSGVYTLSDKTEPVVNDKVLKPYREEGMDAKIWEHTLEELKRVLG